MKKKRNNDNHKLVEEWNKNKKKILDECFNGDDKKEFEAYLNWLAQF